MSFFIGVDKGGGEEFEELGAFEITLDFSVNAEGDVACFFADDDRDGVGGFGDADGGAVPEPHGTVAEFFLADGKDAACGVDAVVCEDNSAVMEGGFGVKDGEEEGLAEFALDEFARFGVVGEVDAALDGEEGAEAFFGEGDDTVGERFEDGLLLAVVEAEEARAPEAGEGVAELGLENDEQREGEEGGEVFKNPADDLEFEKLGE